MVYWWPIQIVRYLGIRGWILRLINYVLTKYPRSRVWQYILYTADYRHLVKACASMLVY